jgi:hypothetical protein
VPKVLRFKGDVGRFRVWSDGNTNPAQCGAEVTIDDPFMRTLHPDTPIMVQVDESRLRDSYQMYEFVRIYWDDRHWIARFRGLNWMRQAFESEGNWLNHCAPKNYPPPTFIVVVFGGEWRKVVSP